MREQSRRLGLSLIGAAGVACALAAAPVTEAIAVPSLTAPVTTTTGTFEGLENFQELPGDPTGVNVFLGIRYGAPPTGTARWQPPTFATPPGSTVVADLPGAECPQSVSSGSLGAGQSEDCLFLNVYVPASATPHSKLPVWIWIHGGALVSGSGALYDPSILVAQNDIIVVTINYRLGVLGWLAATVLDATGNNSFQNIGDAGNYGLMDQQLAMQWVKANIAAFGGDPRKATIGGESAGGLSVSANLESPTAKGLYRGAIIESGSYMHHDLPSQATYAALSNSFVNQDAVCGPTASLTCLQNVSAVTLLENTGQIFGAFGIAPDFGTKVLPFGLHQAFSTGAFNHVPVLQGTNANEGRLFEGAFFPPALTVPAGTTATQTVAAGGPANLDLQVANPLCEALDASSTPEICTYEQEIGFFLKTLVTATPSNSGPTSPFTLSVLADVPTVLAEYPLADFPNPIPQASPPVVFDGVTLSNTPDADIALSQIFTDFVFACNGWDSNHDLSRFVPVYAYEFNDPLAPPGENSEGFPTASEHAAELQFIFNFEDMGAFNAGEEALATAMRQYWGNFIKTGDPNFGGLLSLVRFSGFEPLWPPFNFIRSVQDLVPGSQAQHPFLTFTEEHFCATWEPLLASEPQQP
jgi:para-nitrobenzyl esterase